MPSVDIQPRCSRGVKCQSRKGTDATVQNRLHLTAYAYHGRIKRTQRVLSPVSRQPLNSDTILYDMILFRTNRTCCCPLHNFAAGNSRAPQTILSI
jgi:hypothetical protein